MIYISIVLIALIVILPSLAVGYVSYKTRQEEIKSRELCNKILYEILK